MDYTVTEEHNGRTILDYLKNVLGLSHRIIVKLKQNERGILVNGVHRTVRGILETGDILSLALDDTHQDVNPYLVPCDIPLDIIYEDDDILAVNKPFGMVTHTSHGHAGDSLANAAAYYFKDRPFVFRAVNRLDRDTSGVVLIAKNQAAAYKLSLQMQNGKIHKVYRAVLSGELPFESGTIKTYIRRERESIITRMACDSGIQSEYAETAYNRLYAGHNITIADVFPATGRTHQIRVSFAHIGYPVLGDDLYGEKSRLISRQALHAYKISFCQPSENKYMTLRAPVPDDILNLYRDYYTDEENI